MMPKQVYKKQLLEQKNLGREGKNGRNLMLRVHCHFATLKHLSKQSL